jgi:hypothetical protein
MARNIFSIYDLSILLKLSILFIGEVKITPFNGSIFLMAPGHFLCGTGTEFDLVHFIVSLSHFMIVWSCNSLRMKSDASMNTIPERPSQHD